MSYSNKSIYKSFLIGSKKVNKSGVYNLHALGIFFHITPGHFISKIRDIAWHMHLLKCSLYECRSRLIWSVLAHIIAKNKLILLICKFCFWKDQFLPGWDPMGHYYLVTRITDKWTLYTLEINEVYTDSGSELIAF